MESTNRYTAWLEVKNTVGVCICMIVVLLKKFQADSAQVIAKFTAEKCSCFKSRSSVC